VRIALVEPTPSLHAAQLVVAREADQRLRRPWLAEQSGWSLCALLVVFWGLRLWTGSIAIGWMNAAAVAMTLAGLIACWRVWSVSRSVAPIEQMALISLLGIGVMLWGYLQVTLQPAYGTDSIAFGQYAAQLVLHGVNPYVTSMAPSLQQFLVPSIYHTYLLDGTPVDSVSYPSLAFLLYVPSLLLGVHMQAAVFTNVLFWVAAFVLLWRLLPRELGWTAGILMSFITYASFVVGGVTDALFLPFVFVALWRWDRYGDPGERGLARWIGPVALGLAMAVKQGPWFLLPFLLLGIAHESRARGRGWLWQPARYLTVTGAVFLTVNGPFIAADPVAWARAVAVPLISPMVASGQGLVNLSLFQQLGGILLFYKLAGAVALVGVLTAFALFYPRLKRAWVPLVALVFFWPARSFASYLVDLSPAALLAATTVRPAFATLSQRQRRIRATALIAIGACFAAMVALALTTPSPLRIAIVDTHSTGQQGSIDGIRVRVTNTSAKALEPHFTVIKGGYLTTFWYPLHDGAPAPRKIPAHSTQTLFLRAPNTDSMPGLTGGFVLEAFTSQPATVSASRLVPPTSERLVLTPYAVDQPVQVGRTVQITIQLVGRLGNPTRRAGVPVALAQVVYGQHALIPGESSINGLPEGTTPVRRVTGADGVARFLVRGVQPQRDPVFYQAWIAPRSDVPHGYSNLLSVQFVPGGGA
jgi:uncharacterized membrane protein